VKLQDLGRKRRWMAGWAWESWPAVTMNVEAMELNSSRALRCADHKRPGEKASANAERSSSPGVGACRQTPDALVRADDACLPRKTCLARRDHQSAAAWQVLWSDFVTGLEGQLLQRRRTRREARPATRSCSSSRTPTRFGAPTAVAEIIPVRREAIPEGERTGSVAITELKPDEDGPPYMPSAEHNRCSDDHQVSARGGRAGGQKAARNFAQPAEARAAPKTGAVGAGKTGSTA